jgi:hypothetical protein
MQTATTNPKISIAPIQALWDLFLETRWRSVMCNKVRIEIFLKMSTGK